MKWKVLGVLVILLLCAYAGYDRYKMQRYILTLERKADGIFLKKDLEEWRKKHPIPQVPKEWR